MSSLPFPHITVKSYGGYCVECRCGATWSLSCHVRMPIGKEWGRDCPEARLDAARAQGRREGLDEAARVCEREARPTLPGESVPSTHITTTARRCAAAVRNLNNPETKP